MSLPNRIDFRKVFTNPNQIAKILKLGKQYDLNNTETCYKIFTIGLKMEFEKFDTVEEVKKDIISRLGEKK